MAAADALGLGRRRETSPSFIAAFGVVGAALLAVTALVDGRSSLRVVTFVVGLWALYQAANRLAVRRRGPRFELDLVLAAAWLVIITFIAVFADVLPFAEAHDVSKTLRSPTLLRPDFLSGHPLGTDRQGLDILGGIAYGARVSLVVGLGAVLVGMVIGGLIGIMAAFYGGLLDRIVRLLTDAMLAFPALILLLAMVAVFGASVRNVTIALAILGVPTYIRLARANTMQFAQREFVLAARALGDRDRAIMVREILPNVALPVLSFGFIMVAVLIVAEASLSFLGLSVQRPTPTWGNMIAAGQADFTRHPHLVFLPGAVLFMTVYSLNRLGDKARQLWTPKEGKT